MAIDDHTIHLKPETFEALEAEATRRNVEPDALADQLVREQLPTARAKSMREWLDEMRELRREMPNVDAVKLIREGREELERRTLRWRSS
ncbi:MAG: hypothetical protein JOZ98_00850 [Solirubrobacterales bacterium]|nr:hypothetical protein [Solirubrobacterales bacterium]MBV9421433.1 hypothetical protein [Solirubrobacterales bacterium]MBV9796727.1 hypothetical protein [Solirubrobacterales bacterium]